MNCTIILQPVAVAMSSETPVPQLEGVVGEGIGEGVSDGTDPTLRPPDLNPCYNYVESVNPMFYSIPGGSYFVAPFHQ